MNTESGFEDDKDGGEQYGKRQMIGTDDDGEVEASAECSDMRGKLYLSLDSFFTMTCYRVFILRYEYPTSPFSLRIYKGNEKMGIQE
jgi:hypothetical protein